SQTVASVDLAQALDKAGRESGTRAKVHIKIDTGMHRQGFDSGELECAAKRLAAMRGICWEGAYSHFAESDAPDKSFSLLQMERFSRALGILGAAGIDVEIAHIANSAAILEIPGSAFDMVRPGIILYGLSPNGSSSPEGFAPVMSLRARIAAIRAVGEGEGVGYGLTHRVLKPSRLGLLQVGYADGYPRIVSNRAQVFLRGRRIPVVGRICMDQTMIDITDMPEAALGDEAILFGIPQLPASELASLAGTIDYEITCGISPRVPRIYTE
ncbi:MAG TPA: alanine racemase, partial [Rectinemataceae bacterium]